MICSCTSPRTNAIIQRDVRDAVSEALDRHVLMGVPGVEIIPTSDAVYTALLTIGRWPAYNVRHFAPGRWLEWPANQ